MEKVKLSIRAAEARLRRKMKAKGMHLVKIKEGSRYASSGPYMVVNESNIVDATGCYLDGLAKSWGILKPFEEIGDE